MPLTFSLLVRLPHADDMMPSAKSELNDRVCVCVTERVNESVEEAI